MSRRSQAFDWGRIHADLDRWLTRRDATYESNPARVQSLLRERSLRLARAPLERPGDRAQERLLVFRAGGERCGLLLENAREICRMPRLAVLPGATAPVRGIINWRGEFVVLFDTARLLGLHVDEPVTEAYAIVLRGSEPCTALAADGLDGIARLDLAGIQAAERARQHDLFRGLTHDAVPVLEHTRLLTRLQKELLAA